jgi:hypothetical protein
VLTLIIGGLPPEPYAWNPRAEARKARRRRLRATRAHAASHDGGTPPSAPARVAA